MKVKIVFMKVAILCFRPLEEKLSYEEVRLKRAAIALGYDARTFRAVECELSFDKNGPSVYYRGKPFPKVDVIIPRVSLLEDVSLYASILKQFQLMGVSVLNTYDAVKRAKNKLRTLQILSHYGIPTPRTFVISQRDDLKGAIDRVGGFPVIMKSPFGSWGAGVMIAESFRNALSSLDLIWSARDSKQHMILIQEYVKESKGKDTRVFVVGGEVVASMERSAKKGEFRSNAALGGAGREVSITKEYEDMAIKSAQLLDLEMAGVDIISTKNGPAVLEVNANPGFEELEVATGIDVAKAIVERAVALPVM